MKGKKKSSDPVVKETLMTLDGIKVNAKFKLSGKVSFRVAPGLTPTPTPSLGTPVRKIPERPAFIRNQFLYLTCDCTSSEHVARILHRDGDWYLEVHLVNHQSFFKRLITALNYLFRRHSTKYGNWDEMILRREDLIQLKKMLSVVY